MVGSEETLAESTSLGWDSSSPLHDHKELNDNLWDGHEGALVVQRETAYNWRPQLQTTETDASKFINMQIVRRRMSPSVAFLEFGKREKREKMPHQCVNPLFRALAQQYITSRQNTKAITSGQ